MMCGFTFTVFLSLFQLLPTAPFRILDLGGSTALAGFFLGVLTYASALSAPVTGALADRIGKRRHAARARASRSPASRSPTPSARAYWIPLVLVFFHGLFWSGLLSASSAYMTEVIPESRRAEGIGYWGMATMLATASRPAIGLWVYRRGWAWLCLGTALLNLVMAAIAWRLPPDSIVVGAHAEGPLLRNAPRRVARRRRSRWPSSCLVRLRRHHELRRRAVPTATASPRAASSSPPSR